MSKHFRKSVNKQLGEILVERGIIKREQINDALKYQKDKGLLLGEALVELKYATEEDIVLALACQYGFPFLPLSNYEIPVDVLAAVPANVCVQHCLVPVDKIGKSLTVSMANPLNINALEDVEMATGCAVQTFVSTATDIKTAVKRYYKNLMVSFNERLKEILLREELVSPKDLQRALDEQKKSGGDLSRLLVKLKILSEDQLSAPLSEGLEIPVLNLSVYKGESAVLKLVSKEIAQSYQIFPVSKIGNQLTVAMTDPLNIVAIDNLKALTGLSVNPVLARPSDLRSAIDRFYETDSSSSMEAILKDIKDSEDPELVKTALAITDKKQIENLTQESPIITLTNAIIQQAVLAKASDVFIEPLQDALRVRYRIDGLIREIDRMAKTLHFPVISRIKVLSNLDIAEHRLPQDGRFRLKFEGNKEVDFRVNILPTAMGEKAVLRILDKNLDMLELDKLGFQPEALVRLKEACQKPHGMILACGPTGSGKTTTLYSILKFIDSEGINVITVEDPVEFQIERFNQVNVRPEVGLTFASSLRSILRQDPDVILIGEVRDSQTLDIAVKAALTGHLVVTSLHTTTAAGSLTRMINMGVEPFLLTSSVNAIVAQRLVRRVCPKCREAYTISQETAEQFKVRSLAPDHNLGFYRAKGCQKCFNTGYEGRVGITEILVLTAKIKELILARASELEIKNANRSIGMKTMREDAVLKACAGLTTLEEVVRLTASD